ncbi:MAG: hypothetical protein AB7N80_03815 [Bdellovibrionales bacterium]
MRVILLAGYKPCTSDNCPWLEDENGKPRLEQRIREAQALSQNCIVVLAGEMADRALIKCPSLERCELVFDTNETQANLLTNLRAALALGDQPAIVLPAEMTFGDVTKLNQLASVAVQHGHRAPFHMVQADEQGFPLVLTTTGSQELIRNKTLQGLADPQLTRHVPCL